MPGAWPLLLPGPHTHTGGRAYWSLHAGSRRASTSHTPVHLWDASNFAIFVTHVLDTA